jgi:adiponectin receptor
MKAAAWSLFQFHNQTANIWTHLLGAIIMIVVLIQEITRFCLTDKAKWTDVDAVFQFYCLAASFCLLFSSFFHWFQCISEDSHVKLLRMDLTGAAFLVAANFVGVVYYGFYCDSYHQHIYLVQSFMTLVGGMAAPWTSGQVPLIHMKTGPFIFMVLVGLGTIPFTHWISVTPEAVKEKVLPGILMMFYSNIAGFIVFASRCPERFFPKSLIATQIFASHTLWHICGLLAVYGMKSGMEDYRNILLQGKCPIE